MSAASVEELITRLGLQPHPEGGHYRETWRGPAGPDGRHIGTSIIYLLVAGRRAHWHRIDATELWHFHAGAPCHLDVFDDETGTIRTAVLGPELTGDHHPQAIVEPHRWQSAETIGEWSLVGCTVTPAFEFDHFELAPPGWEPTHR